MPSRGRAVIVNRGKSVRESPRKVIKRFRAKRVSGHAVPCAIGGLSLLIEFGK